MPHSYTGVSCLFQRDEHSAVVCVRAYALGCLTDQVLSAAAVHDIKELTPDDLRKTTRAKTLPANKPYTPRLSVRSINLSHFSSRYSCLGCLSEDMLAMPLDGYFFRCCQTETEELYPGLSSHNSFGSRPHQKVTTRDLVENANELALVIRYSLFG